MNARMNNSLAVGDQTPVILNGTSSDQVTITSVELTQLINQFRKEEGNTTEKRHDDMLKSIRSEIETLEKAGIKGLGNFSESSYFNQQNKEQPCFKLNKAGVLQMLNKESAVVRYKTVQYIEKLEKENKRYSYMIDDPIERAKAWIVEQQEKQQLQLENEAQQKQIEADKPKVVFADAVSVSNNSILIGDLAKLLKQNGVDTGQKRLFEWMRENGYLIKRQGYDYNSPTQKSMDLGLMEIKEGSYAHDDGHVSITKTTKITGKGQQYFINKFLNK